MSVFSQHITDCSNPLTKSLLWRIDTLSYYSDVHKSMRNVVVYAPIEAHKSYGNSDDMPVLYLFHGINGDELHWVENGRLVEVVDSLITEGLLKPLVVVMPDCNPKNRKDGKRRNLWQNVFSYPDLCKGGFEDGFTELEGFIHSRYRVSKEQNKRAIAGLSSGARQAVNIVNLQPKAFCAVGLFSPVVTKKQLPEKNKDTGPANSNFIEIAYFDTTTKEPAYRIYLGKTDPFYCNGKRFYKRLQKQGINSTLYETKGGHTWRSWHEFLIDFLSLVFKEPQN